MVDDGSPTDDSRSERPTDPAAGAGQPGQVETLETLAQEIARTRTLIHGSRGDGHPWTDSVVDSAQRRLIHLRGSRNDMAVAEIRRGHDPIDVAARAHLDPADVARLLAVRLRTALDPTGDF